MRRLIRTVLERAGCDVLEAANTAEAIEVEASYGRPIGLLISTQQPGDRTRSEAIRTIQTAHPCVKIIITSGYTLDERDLPQGATFLPKPFDPATLSVLTEEKPQS